uniref:ATP synthase F0 subunit 8 n=1 Tax=Tuxedo sp. ph57 TaxID=2127006 RepID=A0A514LQF3_9HEMI|nr:ATP synthase F0 subunit 8 [Tuxedo sp. ph57]
MPQMSPMWWSLLFMLFVSTYMLMMMIMYTYNTYEISNHKMSSSINKNINWKW